MLMNTEVILPTATIPTPLALQSRSRIELVCSGSHYDMGLAQGDQLKEKIHSAIQSCSQQPAFRLEQPWWLPHPAYVWLSEQKARRLLAVPLPRDNPTMHD